MSSNFISLRTLSYGGFLLSLWFSVTWHVGHVHVGWFIFVIGFCWCVPPRTTTRPAEHSFLEFLQRLLFVFWILSSRVIFWCHVGHFSFWEFCWIALLCTPMESHGLFRVFWNNQLSNFEFFFAFLTVQIIFWSRCFSTIPGWARCAFDPRKFSANTRATFTFHGFDYSVLSWIDGLTISLQSG